MTDSNSELIEIIERLESDVEALRKAVKTKNQEADNRVTAGQIADLFGVGSETVLLMEGDFAGLRAITKSTADDDVYWDKIDFEKWLAEEANESAQVTEMEIVPRYG